VESKSEEKGKGATEVKHLEEKEAVKGKCSKEVHWTDGFGSGGGGIRNPPPGIYELKPTYKGEWFGERVLKGGEGSEEYGVG